MCRNNNWYLIGYDDAKFIGTKECIKSKEIQGTISWTAPEMEPITDYFEKLLKTDNCHYRGTDIWSIGLIILFILFGNQPYELSPSDHNANSDHNVGEIWLRNYLISLYVEEKISKNLLQIVNKYGIINGLMNIGMEL